MRDFKNIFKVPEFKNIKEKDEFFNRAYATFCVNYMDQIKKQILLSFEYIDNYFDDTEKRNYKALVFEAKMPKFHIVGTDFSKNEKKEKLTKVDKKEGPKQIKQLPKEEKEVIDNG